jgi:hypothetical protein
LAKGQGPKRKEPPERRPHRLRGINLTTIEGACQEKSEKKRKKGKKSEKAA